MEALLRNYLSLLDSLRGGLEQLSALARQKTEAVRKDDLLALDEVLKQEQALALSFRGLEQKREALLKELGWGSIPLSAIAGRFPAHMQAAAKQTVDALRNQYQIYRTSAEVARNTLECNLHEIEKLIAATGGAPVEGPGYRPGDVEPPKAMKTDFRA